MGELACVIGILTMELFQGLGDLQVGTSPASRPQVVVERALDQRVGKGVVTRGVRGLSHEGTRLGLIEEVEADFFVPAGNLGEEVQTEVPTDHRGEL